MNRLNMENNRFAFKTFGKLPIVLGGIYRIHFKLITKNRKMSTCNRLILETLRILTNYAQKPPRTLILKLANPISKFMYYAHMVQSLKFTRSLASN